MPKLVDHEQRRREITDAFLRITVRGGLGAASFREVAGEAGVSVRLVQYYFGTKAELLHAANREVAQRMSARLARRVARLGADAPPRDVVAAVMKAFLPTDKQSREAMIAFFAFYTAQLTDPTLARRDASDVPRDLTTFIASQIRRAHPARKDAELEAAMIAAALPSVASSVLVGYLDRAEAATIVDYALDRAFPS
jgi:TetR/AcrR family transcriptional regulator, transcriptional repressor of bet genes